MARRGGQHVSIIGAGPCGLACARELHRLGHSDWLIYERAAVPGGKAASEIDAAGFTWDQGGHVVFSHFGEFDRLLEEVMGDDVYEHERSSYVRVGDRWVPYPFQNNLRHLAPDDAFACLVGLVEAEGGTPDQDFATWMECTFGDGITRLFMRPYNLKVWAIPASAMASSWIAERVSVVDYRRALHNVVHGVDDAGWGPEQHVQVPAHRRHRRDLPKGRRASRPARPLRSKSSGSTPRPRDCAFADGRTRRYEALVSTMPLDQLVAAIDSCPADYALQRRPWSTTVSRRRHRVRASLDDDRSWLYFADEDVPFYRVTNFAKYAAANVPGGTPSATRPI